MLSPEHYLGINQNHLVPIADQHRLLPQVANAFLAMQHAAAEDGVDVQIASSYRSFERQLHIWQQKWQGQRPLFNIDGKPLDTTSLSDSEKLSAILTWSALPGASRHHWGTDLDVWDKASCQAGQHKLELVPEEYQPGGPCHALAGWLAQYAGKYGFYLPYNTYRGGVAAEPWHLSYAPIAKPLLDNFDHTILAAQLARTDIGGKTLILKQLPSLIEQYVKTVNQANPA